MSLPMRLRPLDSGHLQSDIGQEKWKFTYCMAGQAWKGELDQSDIESSALELGQKVAEYSRISSSVFSTVCPKEFVVDLKVVENDAIELAWKKISRSSVKFSLGSVLLRKCDPGEVDVVLQNASNLVKELEVARTQIAEVNAHNERLSSRLEEFARLKVEMESDLFTKFALILNQKKAKIRSLIAMLEDHGNGEKSKESSDPFPGKQEESAEEPESTPEKQPTSNYSSRITVGEQSIDLDLLKIPRRGDRSRGSKMSDLPVTSTASISAEESESTSEKKPNYKKRKGQFHRITVGESIEFDLSKIPRRGDRSRSSKMSDLPVTSTANTSAQVLEAKPEDDADIELESVRNEIDEYDECDDTVDISELLNNL